MNKLDAFAICLLVVLVFLVISFEAAILPGTAQLSEMLAMDAQQPGELAELEIIVQPESEAVQEIEIVEAEPQEITITKTTSAPTEEEQPAETPEEDGESSITPTLFAGSLPAGEFPGAQNLSIKGYYNVAIRQGRFVPNLIEAAGPIVVIWTNEHQYAQKVDCGRGISSPIIPNGDSWNRTFYGPKTYNCANPYHSSVKMQIRVDPIIYNK